ncbi:MAG: amidase family protein [Deltaproteobacteria bacterium]
MPDKELYELSASETARLVGSGQLSPLETVQACLDRIEATDEDINAFVYLDPNRALAEARAQEKELVAGRSPGPLAGVALGVKDLEDVGGMPTSFGSVAFKDRVADRDAVHIGRLREAGAIVVGKTNTPEFGYTGFTKNRLFGVTRNPWNTEMTPGGSSGGSAAAVAARMVPLATASDGGGSIRIPACYVGAFGMKPTYGRIPVSPILGMQRWIDTVHYGPLTRTIEDAALYMDVTAGYHFADPDSLPVPPLSYRGGLDDLPAKLRIGFSPDLGYARVADDVMGQVEAAVGVFTELGHTVERLDVEFPDLGLDWALVAGSETRAMLGDAVDGHEDELGHAFWRGLQTAAKVGWADMARVQRRRQSLNQVLGGLFADYDLLLTPQLPTEAFRAEGPPPEGIGGQPFSSPMHAVAFTYPFNMSGHPAASVRAGLGETGLPVGLQIVAERQRDELVLQAARAYERERPFDSWPEL